LRGRKGGVLGGKALVALELRSGVVVAMATHADGETNEAKLVPALLPQVREHVVGRRLWVADRQFCDLTQPAAFAQDADQFLVRYHPKTPFYPDAAHPAQRGQDAQGRVWEQDWGWLGSEQVKHRRFVRRLTLYRPGEETIILLTDLLDATGFPAMDLFDLYLARWSIGVSREGSLTQSVQVRPKPRDSGFVAREAPGRESKPVKPSDNTLCKKRAQRSRLQRTVNADVAS
jgi:hypothetical protein